MKRSMNWTIIPTALALSTALSTAIATSVYASPVQTPLSSPVVVSGNSGGSESGSCGFVPSAPSQVVVVNSPTALRFSVQGQGQPTLLITGPGGRNQCVMADSYSGGNIEIPGVWNPGTYSVFVGDRSNSSFPYTLSITQEN